MRKPGVIKPVALLAVIGLLIFFNSRGFLEVPKGLAYKVFLPFQKISSGLSAATADLFSVSFRAKDLIDQNQKLMEENQKLLSEVVRLSPLEGENDFLRQQLDLGKKSEFTLVLADIIGSDIQDFNQLVFIDKGAADGIKSGDVVVLAGRIIFGRVAEVYEKTAKIETIFGINGGINVTTDKSRISGVMIASNSGLLMDLIDPQKKVVPGEKVITAGDAGSFPKGLMAGEVSEVIDRDSGIMKQAKISLPYNLKEIERVFIIK